MGISESGDDNDDDRMTSAARSKGDLPAAAAA